MLRHAQKMEAIGQLTGGIAHDFNNRLQVILGSLDALRRRFPVDGVGGDPDFRRLTEAAIRGAERGADLTQQLLAFARRQPLTPKATDVNRLVSGMSDLLRRTLGESISIEPLLADGLWPVFVDPNQLESALLNLAVNARDAMPGGGTLTIETANACLDEAYAAQHQEMAPGQYVVIAVTDTGKGMPRDVLAKAFEPFFTTKEVGKGSGLGLSQVYGFVKQSGGHAKLYSEHGHGTTAKLYLPRAMPAQAALNAAPPERLEGAGRDQTILVVEDDEDVRAYAVDTLRELGYRVLEASDGSAALRLLSAHTEVRLLLADVGLPDGMNGRQLADEARRKRPDLKVLFTTGYGGDAVIPQARPDPGLELIAKPFSYAALSAKIRRMLAADSSAAD
jgi:CheY-like chemotaxis protein